MRLFLFQQDYCYLFDQDYYLSQYRLSQENFNRFIQNGILSYLENTWLVSATLQLIRSVKSDSIKLSLKKKWIS